MIADMLLKEIELDLFPARSEKNDYESLESALKKLEERVKQPVKDSKLPNEDTSNSEEVNNKMHV